MLALHTVSRNYSTDSTLNNLPLFSADMWPRINCRGNPGSTGYAQKRQDQRCISLRSSHPSHRNRCGDFLHRLLWLLRCLERELLHGHHGNSNSVTSVKAHSGRS